MIVAKPALVRIWRLLRMPMMLWHWQRLLMRTICFEVSLFFCSFHIFIFWYGAMFILLLPRRRIQRSSLRMSLSQWMRHQPSSLKLRCHGWFLSVLLVLFCLKSAPSEGATGKSACKGHAHSEEGQTHEIVRSDTLNTSWRFYFGWTGEAAITIFRPQGDSIDVTGLIICLDMSSFCCRIVCIDDNLLGAAITFFSGDSNGSDCLWPIHWARLHRGR